MNKQLTLFLALGMFFWMIQSCATSSKTASMEKFEYTAAVNSIVQDKCYGCHSADGRSDKAKQALMWDNVPTMTADEQAHILDEIMEVTSERKMPPSRFVESRPEKALTDEEIATFQKWAKDMMAVVEKSK
ncbi:heme-binding domain-containing protein [Flavilitoribacter nigricans]|uniref:Haem-binding domain-containing protein n=1 Tax=Flavilitoribacter nigricans (strain ATCC 23147 / DSM 23189 / NBRC 102662 / NCIMB 1420 / SS-2) TaxID=1122177 RepID=A0A2D0N5S5_FLAN2|nr:heme-binding domain-containing protein [Flavilitoribacter nigricans]PHN03736.1 hypothetical protein CRP01_24590 [Flavilitoribacter nigricans DSM 23189 = NBRC 102662]